MRAFTIAVFIFLSGVGASHAVPISYDFTATATNQTGFFATTGTTMVTGTVTFDTALVDSFPGDGENDRFRSDTPAANQSLIFAMSVTNGAVTRSASRTNNLFTELLETDRPISGPTSKRWLLFILDGVGTTAQISLNAGPGFYGTGNGNLTDMPADPTTLNLGALVSQANFLARPGGRIDFNILSFSPSSTSVPGPAGLPLLGAGLLAVGLIRWRVKGRVA